MARHITDDSGRIVPEGDPEYNEVRIGNLEQRVRELIAAVGELQHRLGKVDGGELAWPGDTYEPPDLPPEIFRD